MRNLTRYLRLAIAWLLAFIALFAILTKTQECLAQQSPLVYPECLDRNTLTDAASAGAQPWELRAIERITQGRIPRTPVDYVRVSQTEVAYGWAHFTACRDRLDLNISCPNLASSHFHYWSTLALLYSDASPHLQLQAWRRIVHPAVDEAHRHGFPRTPAAVMANSAPQRLREYGAACAWKLRCVIRHYATTDRRRHRMRGY